MGIYAVIYGIKLSNNEEDESNNTLILGKLHDLIF